MLFNVRILRPLKRALNDLGDKVASSHYNKLLAFSVSTFSFCFRSSTVSTHTLGFFFSFCQAISSDVRPPRRHQFSSKDPPGACHSPPYIRLFWVVADVPEMVARGPSHLPQQTQHDSRGADPSVLCQSRHGSFSRRQEDTDHRHQQGN